MREWSNITVLTPEGDIDIASVPRLRASIDECAASGIRRIIVNCQFVTFIDSTGLAFLLSRARRLAMRDGLLSLVNASPNVVRILQIAQLVEPLHVSAAHKPDVPLLDHDAVPLWGKMVRVEPGVEHLAQYRHRIAEMLNQVDLSDEDRFDVALAGGEALSNAYDHACASAIVLAVHAYRDRVVIEVIDDGKGFSLGLHEDTDAPTEERGRGIRLMRMLVDRVDVQRRIGAPGTQVRLTKLLAHSQA